MRPSWNECFMETAKIFAKRSHIPTTKVGCVIVRNNRIISVGYNGRPAGLLPIRRGTYELDEVHAEQNAITWAARAGISTDGAELYVTVSPCVHCAKLIIQAGIESVIYIDKVAKNQEACPEGKWLLEERGIGLIEYR